MRRCGTIGRGWQGVDGSLARGPVGEALGGRRDTDDTDEGILRDCDARQAPTCRGAIVQAPGDEVRVGKAVGEQSKARDDGRRAEGVGADLNDVDLQHVARLGALDEDGARHRVWTIEVHRQQIGIDARDDDLAIESIAAVDEDFVAIRHDQRGLEVGVPAVVARVGSLGERAADRGCEVVLGHQRVNSSRRSAAARARAASASVQVRGDVRSCTLKRPTIWPSASRLAVTICAFMPPNISRIS